MAEFGRLKALALRRVLKLENGVPSHDTFSRVFRLLEPTGFYESFLRFMTAFAEARGGVIAVDGYHGRIETHGAEVSRYVGWLRKAHSWPGLDTVGKITRLARAAGECTTVQ